MTLLNKIVITLSSAIVIYFIIFNIILFLDPLHPNIKGLKSLASFPTLFISYFIGSYLARK